MIPTIGRIVHVRQDADVPCRAAIVCGLDYGQGRDTTLYLSVFHPRWNSQPVSIVALVLPTAHWHDPKDCPEYGAVFDHFHPEEAARSVLDPHVMVGQRFCTLRIDEATVCGRATNDPLHISVAERLGYGSADVREG